MNCLHCGKMFTKSADITETETGWHRSCIARFFGTNKLPEIDVTDEVIKQLATDSVNRGLTVPGVQKKLSLHLTEEIDPRLTLVNYPTGYILKPQADEYTALPELEYLIMQMASVCGIATVPFALIRMASENAGIAYITKRIDRISQNSTTQMLAMEDFCQLDGRLTEDKYRGSYERCAKIIMKYSEQPGLDLSELFLRIVFSFVVGNSDMHLKNFSLVETAVGSCSYVLSAAYDMLSTNLVIPADKEHFALTMNGKKQNIRRKDFFIFAETIGIPARSADKMMAKVWRLKEKFSSMCAESFLPDEMKESLQRLMIERFRIIEQ
ncbi:MAG: HipA domain-containing protein [Clostridiaceae bacterium]|nr:HipA domain-containing protein [Clostridiaceae bacterium]